LFGGVAERDDELREEVGDAAVGDVLDGLDVVDSVAMHRGVGQTATRA